MGAPAAIASDTAFLTASHFVVALLDDDDEEKATVDPVAVPIAKSDEPKEEETGMRSSHDVSTERWRELMAATFVHDLCAAMIRPAEDAMVKALDDSEGATGEGKERREEKIRIILAKRMSIKTPNVL